MDNTNRQLRNLPAPLRVFTGSEKLMGHPIVVKQNDITYNEWRQDTNVVDLALGCNAGGQIFHPAYSKQEFVSTIANLTNYLNAQISNGGGEFVYDYLYSRYATLYRKKTLSFSPNAFCVEKRISKNDNCNNFDDMESMIDYYNPYAWECSCPTPGLLQVEYKQSNVYLDIAKLFQLQGSLEINIKPNGVYTPSETTTTPTLPSTNEIFALISNDYYDSDSAKYLYGCFELDFDLHIFDNQNGYVSGITNYRDRIYTFGHSPNQSYKLYMDVGGGQYMEVVSNARNVTAYYDGSQTKLYYNNGTTRESGIFAGIETAEGDWSLFGGYYRQFINLAANAITPYSKDVPSLTTTQKQRGNWCARVYVEFTSFKQGWIVFKDCNYGEFEICRWHFSNATYSNGQFYCDGVAVNSRLNSILNNVAIQPTVITYTSLVILADQWQLFIKNTGTYHAINYINKRANSALVPLPYSEPIYGDPSKLLVKTNSCYIENATTTIELAKSCIANTLFPFTVNITSISNRFNIISYRAIGVNNNTVICELIVSAKSEISNENSILVCNYNIGRSINFPIPITVSTQQMACVASASIFEGKNVYITIKSGSVAQSERIYLQWIHY